MNQLLLFKVAEVAVTSVLVTNCARIIDDDGTELAVGDSLVYSKSSEADVVGMRVPARVIVSAEVMVPALCFLGCVLGGIVAATAGARVFSRHSNVAEAVVLGAAIFAGLGGLWSFWHFANAIDFHRRGYRIRQIAPKASWRWRPGAKACVYEEGASDEGIRQLPFIREVRADGYPAPSHVCLPDETSWNSRVPAWAQHRRAEIVRRIRECAGDSTQITDGAA